MNKLTIIAALLLILTNVIVLTGVAYNRAGEVEASLLLTERELAFKDYSYNNKENSGLALMIDWKVISTNSLRKNASKYSLYRGGNPDWLDENKLRQLAVDVDRLREYQRASEYAQDKILSKEVIYVLEYDGVAYQTVLTEAENYTQRLREKLNNNPDNEDLSERLEDREVWLRKLQISESRLIVIDAGLDAQVLREKYKDNSKFLLLAGELMPYWNDDKLVARVKQLFISSVHVALPHADHITKLTNGEAKNIRYSDQPLMPRYQVKLNIGTRLEPWIEEIKRVN